MRSSSNIQEGKEMKTFIKLIASQHPIEATIAFIVIVSVILALYSACCGDIENKAGMNNKLIWRKGR